MKGQSTIYHPDGTQDIRPFRGESPSLDFLQQAVGGDIEVVPYFGTIEHGGKVVRCAVFCNEHGKMNRLPVNRPVTSLWQAAQQRSGVEIADRLVGRVVVLTGDDEFMEAL
jgi:hypothetical protein